MKDNKTSLIFRMAKRDAPKTWMTEVDALLNHIDDLETRHHEHLSIVDSLAKQREDLQKLMQNTVNVIDQWTTLYASGAEDIRILTGLIEKVDDILVMMENGDDN